MIDVASGKSLKTTKVVEISEQCPGLAPGDKCLLIFSETDEKEREIVQIYVGRKIPPKKQEDLIPIADSDDFDFSRATAKLLGFTETELAAIIKGHMP